MKKMIELKNVNFTYAGSDKKVLDDVSLSIAASEFVVLCGKSGCGKTTLLRHLKKNLMPYGNLTGSICYLGTEIEEMDDRRNASEIGFVQQNPENQIVTDKVWHELAFGLESLGMHQEEIQRRVAEIASYFNIQTWFRKNICELSGGQKQLLNLASIMVMQPKILILDEPTAQLDPIAASEFIQTLHKINQEIGTTILISEHRLEELFPIADRVIVMDQGSVIADDTPGRVGAFLQEGEKHPMFYGMPAVMKIASEVNRICGKDEVSELPLTVREGRLWMEEQMEQAGIFPASEGSVASVQEHTAKQPFWKKKDTDAVVRFVDVWFRYGRELPDILRGLNLSVKGGEWFAILGGNGVGKSTAMKILCKMLKPYRGKVMIEKRLLMLPQNPQALFTEITVWEELYEALCDSREPDEVKQQKITEMLEKMELSGMDQMHPYDLSGGEQQRLALGKILLLEPEILVMDEPTKGLDPFFKRKLAGILTGLKSEGVTILMVSHDIEFCAQYADRCTMFFDGVSIPALSPEDFFAGNNYYTTTANRIARQWFPKAVTWEEVVKRCEEAMTRRR
ncbi:MAG: ATP-binding cassette domain-containing protein [Lachnospiraceae bacterium]|nr:ATP-binding cassette domain-containing protein [Lachnospiraceae bacterium]